MRQNRSFAADPTAVTVVRALSVGKEGHAMKTIRRVGSVGVILIALLGASVSVAAPTKEAVPQTVQAKFDSFFHCVQSSAPTNLGGGNLSICGVKLYEPTLQCLRHHTRTEAPIRLAEWQVGTGRTVYAVSIWCPVAEGSGLGVLVEQKRTGELVMSIDLPRP
jgi:hypothetical protein